MIGERKSQANDRRREERICQEIVEAVNSIILRWDRKLRITFINRYAQEFFGYACDEILGKSLIGTIVPEESAAGRNLRAMIEDIVRSPDRYVSNENETLRRDGTRAWISWTNRAIRDSQGNVFEIISVGNDITSRKRGEEELERRVLDRTEELERTNKILRQEAAGHKHAEEALRQSEEYLARAQQIAHVGVWSWDVEKNSLQWTDEVYRIFGESPESYTPSYEAFKEAIVPEDRDRVDRAVQSTLSGGKHYSEDFWIRRPTGELRYVHCEGGAVYGQHGRMKRVLGVGFDITDRKRAEEALCESEERFRAVFDRAAVGIAIASPEGYLVECNPVYLAMLGYTGEELRHKRIYDITYPEDIDKSRDFERQMKEGSIDKYELEKRYVRKDGQIIRIKLDVSAIRNPDGSLKYNLGVVEDITERKRAEEALNRAKSRAELYLDLMGHDISNMNQAMMGYLELAQELLDLEGHEELIARPLEIIRHSSRLIASVKKLELAQSGKYPVKLMDLGRAIGEVADEYARVPGRDVRINYTRESCLVRANDLLKDVFANLVDNAIRHSEGPLSVDITIEPVLQDGRKYYQVSVADDGPGIPDDLKKKIFRFVDAATGTPGRRGLGLFIVRALVHSYGGKAWVEDRVPGDYRRGSRFVVLLPTAEHADD